MVFPCFPIGDTTPQDDSSVQQNSSLDTFVTAHSNFNGVVSNTDIRRSTVRSTTLRVFTLSELEAATENFSSSSVIGKGGFGSVHSGIIKSLENPLNDITVAVKRDKRGPHGYRQWETEVNVLGEIKHPNLVKLIGYCDEDNESETNLLLVYEYMPNRSLDVHLSSNTPPSWATRLNIAKDAATGLTYLHEEISHQIIFRDFKPSNILLDSEMNAKLSDFGFAREGPQDGRSHVSTMVVGTKGYAAPEYVQTGRLTSKIDVWSYGIFLEELITGQRPLSQKRSEKNARFLKWVCCYLGSGKSKLVVDPRLNGTYSERSMQKVELIANKCLAKEPKSRPTMSEVLQMVKEAIVLENV